MKKINKNYTYYEYQNSHEMFAALDDFLKLGYVICDSIFLCVELVKNNDYVLLSYIHISNPNENIKTQIKALYTPCEVIYPNYDNTLLNVISEIRNNYGYDAKYRSFNLFDKPYSKVVLMILDGLGTNVLNSNLDSNSFLRKSFVNSCQAIFPSTTACATTTIKSGLTPISTAWLGWENYLKELNRNVVLFTGVNYYNDEPTGVLPVKYIPYNMFYDDMDVDGFVVEPDFSNPKYKFDDLLKKSLNINHKYPKSIQYVYYQEPDGLLHSYGCYSLQVKDFLKEIDNKIKNYANSLDDDTILIISADHGHTDVNPIDFYACKPLLRLLKRPPSNDSRCITFSVIKSKEEEFEKLFNILFGSIYRLYKSQDAIDMVFFGNKSDLINPRSYDFLADYVAIANNKYYFNYKSIDNHIFKSHHGGITKDEMIIPICIFRK